MRLKNKLAYVAVFFCVAIVLAVLTYFAHQTIQQKVLQLDLERQKVVKTGINIIDLKRKYGDLDGYMKTLDERYRLSLISLPEQMDQGEFVNFLQQKALENQVKIIMITPQETARDKSINDVEQLSIDIKIECGYFQLINFLKAIEEGERIINFEGVSITSKGDGELLFCELSIIIFALE